MDRETQKAQRDVLRAAKELREASSRLRDHLIRTGQHLPQPLASGIATSSSFLILNEQELEAAQRKALVAAKKADFRLTSFPAWVKRPMLITLRYYNVGAKFVSYQFHDLSNVISPEAKE